MCGRHTYQHVVLVVFLHCCSCYNTTKRASRIQVLKVLGPGQLLHEEQGYKCAADGRAARWLHIRDFGLQIVNKWRNWVTVIITIQRHLNHHWACRWSSWGSAAQ